MNKNALDSATTPLQKPKKDPNSKKNLTFSIIGDKLTWLDFDNKSVWHF